MRNVKIAYILNSLHYSWFWLGTWAIFYASFGGYWAIGLLETVMIVTTILAEIPTGAIGDLIGKKKTLIIGYFLMGISNIWMGFAPNLLHMALSLILLNIGGAFVSGTFNALIYDSLKTERNTRLYPKVLANLTSLTLIGFAIFTVIGGYISEINIRMPYHLNGIFTLLASILAFWLVEPSIDSEKLSIKKYIDQNINGVKHLFRSVKVKNIVLPLLFVSALTLIFREGLDDIILLDFGFADKPFEMSIVVTILMLFSSAFTYLYPRIVKNYNKVSGYFNLLGITSITMLISPILNMYYGAISVIFRSASSHMINNQISYRVNRAVDSRYRATALSTFSMLSGIPYALSIFWVSSITDIVSSKYIALIFGIIIIGYIIVFRNKLEEK